MNNINYLVKYLLIIITIIIIINFYSSYYCQDIINNKL